MAPDLAKSNVRRAEKALLSTVTTAFNNGEKPIAKAIFDIGCNVFGKDDFLGACEEKADVLKNIQPETKTPSKNADQIPQGLISAQDLLEQEICVDEAEKISKLGEEMFSKDKYGKARQEHLRKAVETRNG